MTDKLGYTPANIANFFLEKGKEENVEITAMKLQKIVYIAYGWTLALLNTKLFDEPIEAWQHGPVIPSLFHEFKHFGKHNITEKALSIDWDEGTFVPAAIPTNDEKLLTVLTKVWDIYKVFTGWDLRQRTHQDGTPWSQVYKPGERFVLIPDDIMKPSFEKNITELLSAA